MVQRINGFSGMDVEGMVQKLMAARRIPVDRLYQQKQTIEWQRDSYREMNTKLYDYRNSKLTNYRLESAFNTKKVDITGDTAAVSAKANGDAIAGTITVNVGSLATAAKNASTADIRSAAGQAATGGFDPSAKLNTQAAKLLNYDPTLASYNSFTINGTPITIDPTKDSFNDVIARINATTNVSANYDAVSGKVAFISKLTGTVNGATKDQSQISLTGDFLVKTVSVAALGVAAADASVTVNGLATTSKSNTIKVNGVDITLLKQSASAAAAADSVVNAKTDTDAIVNSVKSFITDYNDMIKTLGDKIAEPHYRDYKPLTDEQKKNMKESEITAWESKAKSGLLKNDSFLTNVLNDMRLDISSPVKVNGKNSSLSSIGITTGTYLEKGKLYLDETKLRSAIEANPDIVKNLFTASGTDTVGRTDIGVAKRMYDDVKKAIDAIGKKTGVSNISSSFDSSILGKQNYQLSKRIDIENKRLQSAEDMYYRQFTAMESAINRFNSQSAALQNAFPSGS